MTNYNFHNLLDPMDFQDLVCMVVQVRESIVLEISGEGKDLGIDGLYCSKNKKTIVQAKRYGTFPSLMQNLNDELKKVKKLNPSRYILGVSINLNRNQKKQILELFSEYIKNTADILSSLDLNNLLSIPKYHFVESTFPKLWLPSINIMTRFLSDAIQNAVNNIILKESAASLNIAFDHAKTFVPTRIYSSILEKFNDNRVIVLSGEPGVGKTTIAYMLALEQIRLNNFEGFIFVNSVENIYAVKDDNKKQVFIWDDFWGSAFYDEDSRNIDSRMKILFDSIIKNKKHSLILTTREYVLRQGLNKHLMLGDLIEKYNIICTVSEYDKSEKARILFNHLYRSKLPNDYIQTIYFNCERIIYNRNYSPRMIAVFLEKDFDRTLTPQEYLEKVLDSIDHPGKYWTNIFNNLSDDAQMLAMILLITKKRDLSTIKECFEKYILNKQTETAKPKIIEECVSELEKTLINSYTIDDKIMFRFNNPAIQDFLFAHVKNHSTEFIPKLLKSICFYHQVLYIYNNLLNDCCTGIVKMIESFAIESFYELPHGDLEYDYYDYHDDYDDSENCKHALHRTFHLLRDLDKNKTPKLYAFLVNLINSFIKNLETSEFLFDYHDFIDLPGIILRAIKEKIIQVDIKKIMDLYYKRIEYYDQLTSFEFFKEDFEIEYSEFMQDKENEIKENLEDMLIHSLDYYSLFGSEYELEMLMDSCHEAFEKYQLIPSANFKEDFYEITDVRFKKPKRVSYKPRTKNLIIPKDDEEIKYETVKNDAYDWLLGESFLVFEEEIINRIDTSKLSRHIKEQLKNLFNTPSSYLSNLIKDQIALDMLIEFFTKTKMQSVPDNIIEFCNLLIEFNLGDFDYEKLSFFCRRLCSEIIESGVIFDKSEFLGTLFYEECLENNDEVTKIAYKWFLQHNEKWITIVNIPLVFFISTKFEIENGADDIFSEIKSGNEANYLPLKYYFYECLDTKNFNKKFVMPILKNSYEKYFTEIEADGILQYLKDSNLEISINMNKCEVDGHSNNLLIGDLLLEGTYACDMPFWADISKNKIRLLLSTINNCKENSYNHCVNVCVKDIDDINFLKKSGIYSIAKSFLFDVKNILNHLEQEDYVWMLSEK